MLPSGPVARLWVVRGDRGGGGRVGGGYPQEPLRGSGPVVAHEDVGGVVLDACDHAVAVGVGADGAPPGRVSGVVGNVGA